MKSKLVTLSAVLVTLLASGASFAGEFVETMAPKQAPFVSQATRADVQAQAVAARAFLTMPNDQYGSVTAAPAQASTLSREEVRKEAIEFARTHKRDESELG